MDNGFYEGVILNHDVRTKSGKDYVYFAIEVDDGYGKKQEWPVRVWLTTDKAIKRARVTLRKIGFDMDTPDGISPLYEDHTHLAGIAVDVEISDNPPYGQQCNIVLDDDKPVDEDRAKRLSSKLRDFAMDNEKPIAAPKRTNASQARQRPVDAEPDPWDKEHRAEATAKAKKESGDIPF